MRLRFAILGVVEQESIDRFFENVKYKNSIFVRKTIAQRKIIQKQKEQSWRIYLIYLSCVFQNYINKGYSAVILCVPTGIFLFFAFVKNKPKTEMEIITRCFSAAAFVLLLLVSVNGLHFTDVSAEHGVVVECYHDTHDTAVVMTGNGEKIDFDLPFYKSFEKNDQVILETKTGLLSIKMAEIDYETAEIDYA